MQYKAILFDLAGTLLDTQNGFEDAEIDAFKTLDVTVDDEDLLAIHTIGPFEGLQRLYKRLTPQQHAGLTDIRRRLAYQYLEQRCTLFEDTPPTLREIHTRRIPTGVVTSARQTHIDRMHVRTNIRELIPILATREDVGDRTKPDPYGLEIACAKLAVPPEKTLFVCDAGFDTLAARNIGMDSCFIERPGMSEDAKKASLQYATYHIRSLVDVLDLPTR